MQLKLNVWLTCVLWTLVNDLAVIAAPSNNKPDHIITNGYPAHVGKAPYIVGLFLREGSAARWCGGSIIGHHWVLTAAHCVDYIDTVTIYYGATRRTQALFSLVVGFEDTIQHPNWPEDVGNDIALIRTPYVDFWSLVNKVKLPGLKDRNNMFEHFMAVTCGWGTTYDGSSLPDWLQCADLPIISNEQCSRSYDGITESILCVDTPEGRSICDGDSGGPLVTHENPRLVGITNFSDQKSCLSKVPAGFTRVTAHLDWIRNVSGIVYLK